MTPLELALAVAAGLLLHDALRSLAIDSIHRYHDARLAAMRRRIERTLR